MGCSRTLLVSEGPCWAAKNRQSCFYWFPCFQEDYMVERKSELKRRHHRREKMFKLKGKLAAAKDPQVREQILAKILPQPVVDGATTPGWSFYKLLAGGLAHCLPLAA